jgi:hypothetical protein
MNGNILDVMPKLHGDFARAYHFLENHRLFKTEPNRGFESSLTADITLINPDTLTVDSDSAKNTLPQISLHCRFQAIQKFPSEKEVQVELKSFASSFEVGIIVLANDMVKQFGA